MIKHFRNTMSELENDQKNVEDDTIKVKGIEAAAIVLMSLDSETIKKILSMMNQEELKAISQSVFNVDKFPTNISNKILIKATEELSSNLELMKSVENIKSILEDILGKSEINSILHDIQDSSNSIWEKISKVEPELLANYLKNEHPQTIALVISKLNPILSAKILSLFAEELSFEVLMRIPKIDSVRLEIISSIENTLFEEFISHNATKVKTNYRKLLADIFNCFDRNSEIKFMNMIEKNDKSTADYIKEYMFTFDHLVKLDNVGIQKLVRLLDKSKLNIALKGSSEEIKNLFFKNMSERSTKIMQDDILAMGPMRISEIHKAQNYVIEIAKSMIENGEIFIHKGKRDELVY